MAARPPLPPPLGQRGQRGRGRIRAQEVPAPAALEVVDDLERARIIRLERGGELIEQARLLPHVAGGVAGAALWVPGGPGGPAPGGPEGRVGAGGPGGGPRAEGLRPCPPHPEPAPRAV